MRLAINTILAAGLVFGCAVGSLPAAAEQGPAAAPANEPAKLTAKDVRAEVLALRDRLKAGETAAPEDLARLDTLAQTGAAPALALLAESYRLGLGRAANPQAARTAYEALLQSKTPPASAYFGYGQLLADPAGPFHDDAAAFGMFRSGFEAGHAGASLAYGAALIDGVGTPADPAKGAAVLEQLAADGDKRAVSDLAERYASGKGLAANPEKAAQYLRIAVAAGEGAAARKLGQLELERGNGAAALAAFEQAQALGEGEVAPWLRRLYLRGAPGLEAQPAKARPYLAAAAATGDKAAQTTLMLGDLKGDFGAASDPAAGKAAVQQAFAQSDIDTLAALAGQIRDPQVASAFDAAKAAQIFETAMAQGNETASKALLTLLKKAPDSLPDRDALQARLGAQDPQFLPPRVRFIEQPAEAAAKARSKAEFAEIARTAAETPAGLRRSLLLKLRKSNPNAYVYVLQTYLKEHGAPSLKADGIMSSATLRAVSGFCRSAEITAECKYGPMSFRGAQAIGEALSK
jgi:TPR repeat protein